MEQTSSTASPRIALITGCLNLGGTTTFLCNFAGELVRRRIPVEILSFEKQNPLASDFSQQNIPVLCLDQDKMIFEDRLEAILRRLKKSEPTVVLATLSATSFETLRYLPKEVLRVGVGQADDPALYIGMAEYAPFIDLVAMVSQEMKRKAEAMPAFSQIPVVYLPYGVPMPAEVPNRNFQRPLRILYLGRLYQEQKRVQLFPAIFKQLQVGIHALSRQLRLRFARRAWNSFFLWADRKRVTPDITLGWTMLAQKPLVALSDTPMNILG